MPDDEAAEDSRWTKAIPPARDRLQSRVLVFLLLPILTLTLCWIAGVGIFGHLQPGRRWLLEALGFSLTFAVVVWALRAGTILAAMSGGIICALIMLGTSADVGFPLRSGLAPLMALFVLTFAATRAGRGRKAERGLDEDRHGRSAAQVLANLGAAGLVVAGLVFSRLGASLLQDADVRPAGFAVSLYAPVLMLAALCEATADTVSSEIGQAFGGSPRMLLTMQRVSPGTDGAVSLLGTAAGIIGGGFVAAAGMWGMHLNVRQTLFSWVGGIAGLLFDSLLGETLEAQGWLGNDLVNFLSTVSAVGVTFGLMFFL